MKESKLKKAKEKIKTWWNEYKTVIKVGGTCLGIGLASGYLKGHSDTIGLFLKNGTWEPDETEGDFVYDETNTDDSDLLKLIKQEQESTND